MKGWAVVLFVIGSAAEPALAGEWSVIASGHWLEKTGKDESEEVFSGSAIDFDFEGGPGVGIGLLYEFTPMWGIEAKASFAQMNATVRTVTSDAIFLLDLDPVDGVPLTVVLQWRPWRGTWRPYLGAGGSQIFLGNVPLGDGRVEFDTATGLVLNAGFDFALAERWFANLDLKYIPFETFRAARSPLGPSGRVRFEPLLGSAGLRYRF
ncbi:MAG TPA: OmpW family outer membrane protein [Thermoanaerobaculia bacterium]|nr:OmpW family outer membrane protein [Thermoanaerobaculia bacterium]